MYRQLFVSPVSLTPKELFLLARHFSTFEGTLFFYSGGTFEMSKVSYLCLFPYESLWVKGEYMFHAFQRSRGPEVQLTENPWTNLKEKMAFGSIDSNLPQWCGYIGYEMGCFADSEKPLPYRPSNIPDAYFIRHKIIVKNDQELGGVFVYIREESIDSLSEMEKGWVHVLQSESGVKRLLQEDLPSSQCVEKSVPLSFAQPLETRQSYKEKIEKAKELIFSGEIYQINLSQQILLKGKKDPFAFFQKVSTINPAPFMCYIRLPNFTIVSTSPERFICKCGDMLETRPIKGTAPRGRGEVDLINRDNLMKSTKERAELLMITDLMRNDLGKVSQMGSVITERLWHCEEYANVFHLNSIIRSTPKESLHSVEIVRALFPGGSITGCPKLRAMEVIYELEKRPRGIYTGSVGYFAENGDFNFNIAIRTLLWKEDLIDIQLGGGIVADSDPSSEYLETLHKGASIFESLGIDISI